MSIISTRLVRWHLSPHYTACLRVSVEALTRHRLRTSLSILGVVLGVAAVIAVMSVSEGARREILRQVELLGLDNVVVHRRGLPGRIERVRWSPAG